MQSRTQRGYLMLADLSGFTAFMTASELEHAHDIVTELIGLVVRRLGPNLNLAEVEGDAVYVYAVEPALPSGETLLNLVEDTYTAFRDRAEAIDRHSTCPCSACRSVTLLDLKFVVHYGEFILQEVAGSRKPLGSDVNLAHRLLKNSVGQATGWKAYALLTQPAMERAGLSSEGWHAHVESYESLGQIPTYSLDLPSRYATRKEARRVLVPREQADLNFDFHTSLPPAETWEWLNDPKKRTLWEGLDVRLTTPASRLTGVGTTTHCVHGSKVQAVQTILDWRPFDYYTYESRGTGARSPESVSSVILSPSDEGTRVEMRIRVEARPRWVAVPIYRAIARPIYRRTIARLLELARPPAHA